MHDEIADGYEASIALLKRVVKQLSVVDVDLEAVKKSQVDGGGTLDGSVTGGAEDVNLMISIAGAEVACDAATTSCTATGGGDLDCIDISTSDSEGGLGGNYLASVPADPSESDANESKYYLQYDLDDGSVTVGACEPEAEGAGGSGSTPTIQLSR